MPVPASWSASRMGACLCLTLALMGFSDEAVEAQQLAVGDSIRVGVLESGTASGSLSSQHGRRVWTVGILVDLTPDTAWYRAEGGRSLMSAPVDGIRLQRATHSDRRWVGMVVGGVALGAIGGVIGYSGHEPRYSGCFRFSGVASSGCGRGRQLNTQAEDTATVALLGLLTGGGLGYLFGKTLGRWETVTFDQFASGGRSISVSLTFRPNE